MTENLIEGAVLMAAWVLLLSGMMGIGGVVVWVFERIAQVLRSNSRAPRATKQATKYK